MRPPAPVRPREVRDLLRNLVGEWLGRYRSVAQLLPDLDAARTAQEPQGCGASLDELEALAPPTGPAPVFTTWPPPSLAVPLAMFSGLLAALGAAPAIVAPSLALVWFAAGLLLHARQPTTTGELGVAAALAHAAVGWGLPVLTGWFLGAVLFTAPPGPWSAGLTLLAALIFPTTVAMSWRRAVQRWLGALELGALRAQVTRIDQLLEEVVRVEWRPSARRALVTEGLRQVTIGLTAIREVLTGRVEGLFAAPGHDQVSGATAGWEDDPGAAPDIYQEACEVVVTDLIDLTIAALPPCWAGIEAGRSTEPAESAQAIERLLVGYREHVERHGLLAPPPLARERTHRAELATQMWSGSKVAEALCRDVDDEMTQLCHSGQLGAVSALAGGAQLVRFAPVTVGEPVWDCAGPAVNLDRGGRDRRHAAARPAAPRSVPVTDPTLINRARRRRGGHLNGTDPASEPLHCRTVEGGLVTLRLTALGEFRTPGARLPTRMVSVDGGPPLLQKRVPRTPAGEPGPLEELDREIWAAHRFALAFPPEAYPAELPRLRYYDVDSAEPFALLEPYRGQPVAEVHQQLAAQDRYRLQVGLLRALHLAAAAGVTHGRVDLGTLRWDAATSTVQLVDFEQAARIGERRQGSADGSLSSTRDDVWDAGLAIWRVSYPAHTGCTAPDLTEDGGALSALLAGVFADQPTDRPTPGDLLSRLRESTEMGGADLGATLRAGAQAFDNAVQRTQARRAEEQAQARPARWWNRWRAALTTSPAQAEPPAVVRCPVCLDAYPRPDDDELWFYDNYRYHQDSPAVRDAGREVSRRVNGYRRCPNPSKDTTEHYLPATYHDYDPPLVVAMIGQPEAGKTHLLAAMIREIVERGGLTPFGLTATPPDLHRHDVYRQTVLTPAGKGTQLARTSQHLTDPAEILLIRGSRGTRPLVFFDVAGEDQQAVGDGELVRFLTGTSAVIFVHGLEPTPERGGNQAFEMSLARLRAVPDVERLPVAIVATKSDRLRYVPPVDRWLRRDPEALAPVDAALLQAQSRDVFAFLHHRQEHAALAPLSIFDRCTLHFASASGGEVAPDAAVFPRGFEPVRVLEPLVAILAMAGMIDGAQAS